MDIYGGTALSPYVSCACRLCVCPSVFRQFVLKVACQLIFIISKFGPYLTLCKKRCAGCPSEAN